MEDLSGSMAQDSRVASPRREPKGAKSWTLLLVGELGNIVSFRLSKPLIVCLTVGFATICAFAVFSIYSYYKMFSEHESLVKGLDEAQSELVAANKAKEEAQIRLAFLETKAKPEKKAKPHTVVKPKKKVRLEKKTEPAKTEDKAVADKKPPIAISKAEPPAVFASADAKDVPSEEVEPVEEPTPAQPTDEDEAESGDDVEQVSPEDLLVENLEIWREVEARSVKFRFSLKNVGVPGSKIRGYTFVVFKPEEGSQEPARGSPWTPLKDGRPTIFKRGQYFSIARFKYVRGTVPQIQYVERFETATIYVFTETGSLLLEKVYDVDEILRS